MPGVDYAVVRSLVTMSSVLSLIGFVPSESLGAELRGPCPIHVSSSSTSRSFAGNIRKHNFHCFKCGAKGNQLDLWVAVAKLPIHQAARDLCEKSGISVPDVKRW